VTLPFHPGRAYVVIAAVVAVVVANLEILRHRRLARRLMLDDVPPIFFAAIAGLSWGLLPLFASYRLLTMPARIARRRAERAMRETEERKQIIDADVDELARRL
jgi:hypothetical protein